jgi:LmbE family N-acetylglucosaminyl deacetylase
MALREVREREAMAVASGLGIRELEFWRLADGELATGSELVDRVAALVRETVLGTVFFPSRLDFHPDHRAAAEIVWAGILGSGVTVEAWAYGVGGALA